MAAGAGWAYAVIAARFARVGLVVLNKQAGHLLSAARLFARDAVVSFGDSSADTAEEAVEHIVVVTGHNIAGEVGG